MSATVFINGKFTRQRTTGVQRVAEQLVRALDALPPEPDEPRWVLLHPPGGGLEGLGRVEQRAVGSSGGWLHAWEQLTLPRAARGGLLLGLAGGAPMFGKRQAVLIHDAAVWDHPEAYAPAFVAWYRLLFKRLGRQAEQLFTVSAFSQSRLAECLALEASRLQVLPNGADHLDAVEADETVLDRYGLRDRRYLLAVASANPTKNLGALVRAFTGLGDGQTLLAIVGSGNRHVFVEEGVVADLPNVVRTGGLGDGPLKALYRHAEALVFPSLYEGFGLPPLEAMRLGCPVITSRAASLSEVCGDAALYVDAASVDSIGDGMRRLVGDQGLRKRLRAAGKARADLFTWAASAASLRATLMDATSA